MKEVFYAKVKSDRDIKKIHFIGLPKEISNKEKEIEEMGTPVVVIITKDSDGSGYMLYRYNKDKQCVGDTWHLSIEDAKNQAEYEYEIKDSEWNNVPNQVDNYIEYSINSVEKSPGVQKTLGG